MTTSVRLRATFAAAALGTVALGLLLQRVGSHLPPAPSDVLGDALWAMMIAWLVGAAVPEVARWKRGWMALAFCWAVEASQLYHAPGLDAWRAGRLGHLVLGTGFDPRDLLAYALGVLGSLALEGAVRTRRPTGRPEPWAT